MTSPPPQRQIITPYDATEDLRAKVKLIRHDLNEIKQSYLMSEERKEKIDNRNVNSNNLDLKTNAHIKDKFITNLVPYEKNQSHKINAASLTENPKNLYNYLGEKESPTKSFVPISNVNAQKNIYRGLFNGDVEKTSKTLVKDKINEEKHMTKKKQTSEENKSESTSNVSETAVNLTRTGATPKPKSSNGAVPKR